VSWICVSAVSVTKHAACVDIQLVGIIVFCIFYFIYKLCHCHVMSCVSDMVTRTFCGSITNVRLLCQTMHMVIDCMCMPSDIVTDTHGRCTQSYLCVINNLCKLPMQILSRMKHAK